MIRGYELTPASVLAPYNYTQLVWLTVLGYVVFSSLPDSWTILGSLIVVGSGLYVFYLEGVRRKSVNLP